MRTECNTEQLEFQGHGTSKLRAVFDGWRPEFRPGALLLRDLDARVKSTAHLTRVSHQSFPSAGATGEKCGLEQFKFERAVADR